MVFPDGPLTIIMKVLKSYHKIVRLVKDIEDPCSPEGIGTGKAQTGGGMP
jgi:hypothetical protein